MIITARGYKMSNPYKIKFVNKVCVLCFVIHLIVAFVSLPWLLVIVCFGPVLVVITEYYDLLKNEN